MTYAFNGTRYGLVVFGISIVLAVLAGLIGRLANLDLTGGALVALPLIFAVALEARRYGRSLTAPPEAKELYTLARQTAVAGALTYLLLLFVGGLLIQGPQMFLNPMLIAISLGLVGFLGAMSFVVGFFIIRSVAAAALRDKI